jgi:hypothetical protein
MVIKMDTNNEWLQALGLLFLACEPLVYDCLRTEEEQRELISNITTHTYYCYDVKRAIELGTKPKTWDEWNQRQKDFWNKNLMFEVEEGKTHLDSIDTRSFGDTLTNLFSMLGIHRK